MDRLYCTLAELIDDLQLPGVRSEAALLARIQSASDWIDRNIGRFVPVTETRRLDGPGGLLLFIPPLTAVTSIDDDTTTLLTTDYLLYPRNRRWENGPYTRVEIDPDAGSLSA